MKKRILHVLDSAGFYGAEQVILDISLGILTNEYENIIGCFTEKRNHKPELGIRAEENGLNVKYIYLWGKFNPFSIIKVARFLQKEKIDLIHSHGYKTDIICFIPSLILRIPIMATKHLFKKAEKRLKFYIALNVIFLKFFYKVICVSEDIKKIYIEKGINREKLKVINNGINILRINNKIVNKLIFSDLNLLSNPIIFGSLGRLNVQKGYSYLIKAAKQIVDLYPNSIFIIAGEGPQKKQLVRLISEHNLENNFYLFGYCKDPINFLLNIDIFILPSIDEGLPIALLEAMACKLPIIATNVGAISKVIINGYNGLIGESGSIRYLFNSMKYLIENKEKSKDMGKNAYKSVNQRFSNKHMADEYLHVYKSILD